ncbi:unnamed protein product [Linum tenue]|uniref:Uncharacterized protein n=1 Tax=Linum tenue TaxID=586396 RepID=A0AAV0RDM6_9ROSI|nr:unnamed protein product [Linum tenue]
MVPISRLISFASKHAPRQHSLSLLRRFSLSRNPQSRSYTKSTKHGGEKRETQHVYTIEEPQREKSYATFILPAALLGFGGLAAFLRYNDERRAIPRGETQKEQFSPGPVIGGPFSLIDTEKRVVTERDFLGKWVLLYFGYTSSPDIGPEQVKTMAETIDKLESQENLKLLPVFVTLDPQRDTPTHLRAYLKEFDPRIVGFTGAPGAVRQMALEYRVFFRKIEEDKDDYLVEANHNFYLIGPNKEVVKCFGPEYNAEHLTEAIAKEMKRKAAS